ncbi:MAG: pinensin family lanthipeptide [Bacteroidota bacterium]
MKTKLALQQLTIKSFVTKVESKACETVKGGRPDYLTKWHHGCGPTAEGNCP